MPGESHQLRRAEHSSEEPLQEPNSLKKRKKKKSESEKKRKRKHESHESSEMQALAAQRNDAVGDMIAVENAEEKRKGGNDDADRIQVEDVNEPSLPVGEETQKKKKQKRKERKVDHISDQVSDEKPSRKKSDPEVVVKKSNQENVEGSAEKTNETESPGAGKKRKKKKKNRKSGVPSGEGDGSNQTVVEKEAADAVKVPKSKNVFKSHDGPGGEPRADEEELEKDIADGAGAAKSKQKDTSLENVSKQTGKKRKREGQRTDRSDQHPVNTSDRGPLDAKQERLPDKRVKRGQGVASNPVNAKDAIKKVLSGAKTQSPKSTNQQQKSETEPGASAKEVDEEPFGDKELSGDEELSGDKEPSGDKELSGDKEDEDTPLDDKRLPRTLFVGNVPHTANRKQLRKLFAEFGPIESIRIRNVIPDNPKIPKKAALLAQRLAKFSNSFSAYVVFKQVSDMDQVLHRAVNGTNMTIFQDHHLRVTKALQTKGRRRLSVFIGNLPFDCSDEELITTFMPIAKECGVNLLNVRVSRDSDTGVGRGVGFATFDDMMGIQACMNKAGEIKLRGRVLRIERAFKTKMMKSKSYKRRRQTAFGRKG